MAGNARFAQEAGRLRKLIQGRTYTCYPNKMGWEKLSFDWEQGILQFWIPEGEFQFHFGTESYLQQCFLDTGYTCECIGYWKMGHFILKCFVMGEEMGNVQIDFAWKDSRLSMRAVCTPDAFKTGMEKRFQGFASAEYNNV